MIAVMVGGPLHGRTQNVPDPPPPEYRIPRPIKFGPLDEQLDLTVTMPEPYLYELRWYQGRLPWRVHAARLPAYLCTNTDKAEHPPAPHNEDDAYYAYYAYAAASLWHTHIEARLPTCIVPDCTDKGRLTFTAAEHGRLAGREWKPGDEIRVCHNHGHDIYRAAGARGIDQLAEWLRPDAKLDALDEYDLERAMLERIIGGLS